MARWDAFIGDILRWLYGVHPGSIDKSGRSLSFSELVALGSIDAAREKIVEDEIDTVLRKSHIEQFDYLEDKLQIPLRKDLDIWPIFVELTQRRHLIAHTNGRVTFILKSPKNKARRLNQTLR